jgi:hypothetical protein
MSDQTQPQKAPPARRVVDPELIAMADCDAILEALPAAVRARVIAWLANRHYACLPRDQFPTYQPDPQENGGS